LGMKLSLEAGSDFADTGFGWWVLNHHAARHSERVIPNCDHAPYLCANADFFSMPAPRISGSTCGDSALIACAVQRLQDF
jgi:hypothetical protein